MKGLDPMYKVGQIHKFDKGRRCWARVIDWFFDRIRVLNLDA